VRTTTSWQQKQTPTRAQLFVGELLSVRLPLD
jgi:hypothetical protein